MPQPGPSTSAPAVGPLGPPSIGQALQIRTLDGTNTTPSSGNQIHQLRLTAQPNLIPIVGQGPGTPIPSPYYAPAPIPYVSTARVLPPQGGSLGGNVVPPPNHRHGGTPFSAGPQVGISPFQHPAPAAQSFNPAQSSAPPGAGAGPGPMAGPNNQHQGQGAGLYGHAQGPMGGGPPEHAPGFQGYHGQAHQGPGYGPTFQGYQGPNFFSHPIYQQQNMVQNYQLQRSMFEDPDAQR